MWLVAKSLCHSEINNKYVMQGIFRLSSFAFIAAAGNETHARPNAVRHAPCCLLVPCLCLHCAVEIANYNSKQQRAKRGPHILTGNMHVFNSTFSLKVDATFHLIAAKFALLLLLPVAVCRID